MRSKLHPGVRIVPEPHSFQLRLPERYGSTLHSHFWGGYHSIYRAQRYGWALQQMQS